MKTYILLLVVMLFLQSYGFLSDNEDFTFDKLSSGSDCCEITIASGFCDCAVLHDCLETCPRSQCEYILGDCFTRLEETRRFDDDEEYIFDGSGSGSSCFDITTVSGLCDCAVLHDCLETCPRSQCEYILGDCITRLEETGKCDGQNNTTNIVNRSTIDGSETTWVVAGSAVSVILVTAAVAMLALRKKTCCCSRKENSCIPQAIVYQQPNALYQADFDGYSTIHIETMACNGQQNGSKIKKETQPMITSPSQKLVRQVSNSSNDYQLMPDMFINDVKEPKGHHMVTVKEEEADDKHRDTTYQTVTDLPVHYSNHYQAINEPPSSDKNEAETYYQPMAATNDRTSQYYTFMGDTSGVQADDEYTEMNDAHDRKCDVKNNSTTSENVYYGNDVGDVYSNEPIKENLIPKCSNVRNLREDEIYEKMEC
nr:uncharacterized protein LOC105341631 isoform X2 [Crassostrea gigas]